jgi:hypothetical protein
MPTDRECIDNVGLRPNIVCLFPVFHLRLFAVWPHQNRKSFALNGYFFCHADYRVTILKQLMSEMKYLRDRVDTLPTGPIQGLSTGLQTSHDFREPSFQSSSVEEMEIIEQTELPSFPQVTVPIQPLETRTSANLQVSEMAYFRALVRKHVSSEVCPPPPESPSLSQPKFMLFGAQTPLMPEDPRLSAKALAAPTFPVHHRL